MADTKEKPKPVDLSAFDTVKACDKGFELELEHPVTKKPLGVFITVLGKDSEAFRKHVRETGNDRLRRQFQQTRKGKDAEAPTIDQIEDEAIDLLVACTIGWRNVVHPDAGPMEFTEDNARRIYKEFPAIRAQVDEAIGDLENFMQA